MATERLLADGRGLLRAAELVTAGRIVAFPTDTVYGVGCRWGDDAALRRLFDLKGRPAERRVPVLVRSPEDIRELRLVFGERARRLASTFWPGPLTIVVAPIEHGQETVGVRAPDHPTALALLRLTGPMRVTSANRSGEPDALTAQAVHAALGSSALLRAVVDGGPAPGGRASTVIDLAAEPPRIVREGPIPREQIVAIIGPVDAADSPAGPV